MIFMIMCSMCFNRSVLTLPSGWQLLCFPMLRPVWFGPVHSTSVPIGYRNISEVLANCRRISSLTFSGPQPLTGKIQTWNVFVASWQNTYTGSDMMFLPPHCMLRMLDQFESSCQQCTSYVYVISEV